VYFTWVTSGRWGFVWPSTHQCTIHWNPKWLGWQRTITKLLGNLRCKSTHTYLGTYKVCVDFNTMYIVHSTVVLKVQNPLLLVSSKLKAACSFVRASPAVVSMWPSTVKLDEEKSKNAGLAEEMVLAQHNYTGIGCWWNEIQIASK
jgi:hypothetical protein